MSKPTPAKAPTRGIAATPVLPTRVPAPVAAFDLDALADGWRDVLDG